jgi:hypothetical protein
MTVSEDNLKDPMYWIRWSVNSGLVTGTAQTLLYSCAAMCHPAVRNVEMSLDVERKIIEYTLGLDSKDHAMFSKFKKLSTSDSIISLWRLRRMVRKQGSFDLQTLVKTEVNRILGEEWTVIVDVIDADKQPNPGRDESVG